MTDVRARPRQTQMTDSDTSNLVTVVIPTYNRAARIGQTLDSIAAQSHRPIEIVIVDDGSTDNTAEVVRTFCRAHPDLAVEYRQQEQAGCAAARNAGVQQARGNYVQFLDSDDVLYPDKISRQIGPLLRGEAEVAYSDYEVWDACLGRRMDRVCLPAGTRELERRLVTRGMQLGCALHTHAAVEAAGGFAAELWTSEDWDFHLRQYLLARQRFIHVPGAGLKYRWSGASLCSDYREVLRRKLPVLISLYDQCERQERLTPQLRSCFVQLAAQSAYRCYRQHDETTGDGYLLLLDRWDGRGRAFGPLLLRAALRLLGLRGCARLMNVLDGGRGI